MDTKMTGYDDELQFDGCRSTTDDEQGGAIPGAEGTEPSAPFGGAPFGEAPVGAPDLVLMSIAMPPILRGDLGVAEGVVWAVSSLCPTLGWRERAEIVSSVLGRTVTPGAARKCLCIARKKGYDVPSGGMKEER